MSTWLPILQPADGEKGKSLWGELGRGAEQTVLRCLLHHELHSQTTEKCCQLQGDTTWSGPVCSQEIDNKSSSGEP